jgi:hypothetical protein
VTTHDHISPDELKLRVIYSLATSAVKLARAFRIPLKDLLRAVETAYFREVRNGGATLSETADALGVSQRTAVRLSKQLREAFLLPEVSHNLPRRIEVMLATRPMGVARLVQLLPNVNEDHVRGIVDGLVAAGRLREVSGRTTMYETASDLRRLPRDSWIAKVGALNSLAENLANTAYGRFFRDEPRAFARTLSFSMRPGALERLGALYEASILDTVRQLNTDADEAHEHVGMQMSVCWAPYEYLDTVEGEES